MNDCAFGRASRVAESSPETARVGVVMAVEFRVPVMNAVMADRDPVTAAETAPMYRLVMEPVTLAFCPTVMAATDAVPESDRDVAAM